MNQSLELKNVIYIYIYVCVCVCVCVLIMHMTVHIFSIYEFTSCSYHTFVNVSGGSRSGVSAV